MPTPPVCGRHAIQLGQAQCVLCPLGLGNTSKDEHVRNTRPANAGPGGCVRTGSEDGCFGPGSGDSVKGAEAGWLGSVLEMPDQQLVSKCGDLCKTQISLSLK